MRWQAVTNNDANEDVDRQKHTENVMKNDFDSV